MSLQQVNLYRDELKKQKLTYSAAVLVQISVVFIVVLSLVAGVQYFRLQQHQSLLAENQQKQRNAMDELQKLQTVLSKRKKDALLRKVTPTPKRISSDKFVTFIGGGSVHITKKDGKRVSVRFEPGVYELAVSDPEIIEVLRKKGYKEK